MKHFLIAVPKSAKTDENILTDFAAKLGAELNEQGIYEIEGKFEQSEKIKIHFRLDGKFRYCWYSDSETDDFEAFSNDSFLQHCFERMKLEKRFDFFTVEQTASRILPHLEESHYLDSSDDDLH